MNILSALVLALSAAQSPDTVAGCEFSAGQIVVWDREFADSEECTLIDPHGTCPIVVDAEGKVRVFVHCLEFGDGYEGAKRVESDGKP